MPAIIRQIEINHLANFIVTLPPVFRIYCNTPCNIFVIGLTIKIRSKTANISAMGYSREAASSIQHPIWNFQSLTDVPVIDITVFFKSNHLSTEVKLILIKGPPWSSRFSLIIHRGIMIYLVIEPNVFAKSPFKHSISRTTIRV